MNSRVRSKTQWHNSVPLGCHVGAPQRDTNLASSYIFTSWIDQFCKFLAYEKWHRPQSWRGSFLIYLLSFTRFWAFDFDFWWCDTVKTSNSDLRFFTILDIICYTVPFFRNFQLIQSLRPYLSITISNCMCNEH